MPLHIHFILVSKKNQHVKIPCTQFICFIGKVEAKSFENCQQLNEVKFEEETKVKEIKIIPLKIVLI